MQEIEAPQRAKQASTVAASSPTSERPHLSARWVFLAIAVLTLLLLALLPPYISVNRYGHRISTSISSSLGRPVHFDHVSLNLLPVPSFTITNFVVEEDPAFGSEPTIRANTVVANLRFRSLWRRRIEFARISFAEPSLNLVHDRRGKWNFEGILLQAAHIDTAPTAQPAPGSIPRFPYIEATGARVNLKEGAEKTPFSLTEADFALWLPDPTAWKTRVSGRPVRTDTSTSDTGTLQIEATLGRASSLISVPLHLQAAWTGAPLGEASRLFVTHDLGLRGEIALTVNVLGSLSSNSIETHLSLNRLRRSDFVPEQTLSIAVDCNATATRIFHEFSNLRCSWPVPDSNGATLALAGSIPDVLQPASADIQIGTARLPAAILLNWLRIASSRIPPGLSATGLLSGSLTHEPSTSSTNPSASQWTGQATIPELTLSGDRLGATPLILEDVFLHSAPGNSDVKPTHNAPSGTRLILAPLLLPLGGREPAILEGSADRDGYALHLTGDVALSRLLALGASVPQLGDGLPLALPSDALSSSALPPSALPTSRVATPTYLDLSAYRPLTGLQSGLRSGLQTGIQVGIQVWTDHLAHTGPAPVRPPRSRHTSRPRTRRRRP